jgi:hypothetical protein
MLRLLLIIILVFYVLYKLGVFRSISSNTQAGQRQAGARGQRPADGNVHVDSTPGDKKRSTFKGGEYIDYEEVK